MNNPGGVHTADNAIPPLDGDLADALDTLTGIHPGLEQIVDGLRLLALDRHTTDTTQTLVAALGGWEQHNVTATVGLLIARLATADSNPCLRTLPEHQQKLAQLNGEATAFAYTCPTLAQFASDTSAAIDGA